MVTSIVREQGYSVCAFRTEAEALSFFERVKPHLTYSLDEAGYTANHSFQSPARHEDEMGYVTWVIVATGERE